MAAFRRRRYLIPLSILTIFLLAFLAPYAITRFFPVATTYSQFVNGVTFRCPPSAHSCWGPPRWVGLNHTIVVKGATVESFLEATALEEPYPSPTNVSVAARFWPSDNLVPLVKGGEVEWRGELHQGNYRRIHTTFALPRDGRYFVAGQFVSYLDGGSAGAGTRGYYLDVSGRTVTKVYDTLRISNVVEVDCVGNCPTPNLPWTLVGLVLLSVLLAVSGIMVRAEARKLRRLQPELSQSNATLPDLGEG